MGEEAAVDVNIALIAEFMESDRFNVVFSTEPPSPERLEDLDWLLHVGEPLTRMRALELVPGQGDERQRARPRFLHAGNVELMHTETSPKHDVYAYGVIAPSTLIELVDPFPAESGYAEIGKICRSFGGEAAGGAYVLARLGVPTKLTGSELGTDEASRWVVERLSAAGVDCRDIAMTGDGGVTELVVASRKERTIFATYGRMLADRAWSEPVRADVRSSRMVCLDPFFGEAAEMVVRWCREDGIPYVTVDTLPGSAVARGAVAVVISQEYANRTFGDHEVGELLEAYVGRCNGLVILTRGSGPVWYRRTDTAARQSPAFDVKVRDTAGAGDSFRAGVIFGILHADTDDDVVRIASGLAAMVCQSSPGVLQSPTRSELEAFLLAEAPPQ